MRSSEQLQEQLTDAISRGRLCLAEGSGFTKRELDALCELGAEKLELGLVEDAILILRGLVALYPYSSKYYLCLGIALIHATQFASAASSLELATTLEPDNVTIGLYLIEAYLRSGKLSQAKARAKTVDTQPNLSDALKARMAPYSNVPRPTRNSSNPPTVIQESERPAMLVKPQATFKLPNGQPLPLENSHYEVTQPWVPVPKPTQAEETKTDIPLMTFDESITITAVVGRRRPKRPKPSPDKEVTQTAVVVRRKMTQQSFDNSNDTAVTYFADTDLEP